VIFRVDWRRDVFSSFLLPPTLYNFSLPALQFSPVSIIPLLLHTHSFIYILLPANTRNILKTMTFENQATVVRKYFHFFPDRVKFNFEAEH
jgi:hypothetical protein